MRPTLFTRLLLATMVAAALIGGIDAGRGGQWDLLTLFAVLSVLSLYLLLRTSSLRPLVPIRGDLVRWMTARASVSAERTEMLADPRDQFLPSRLDGRHRGSSRRCREVTTASMATKA